jgi:hypothetical protein
LRLRLRLRLRLDSREPSLYFLLPMLIARYASGLFILPAIAELRPAKGTYESGRIGNYYELHDWFLSVTRGGRV